MLTEILVQEAGSVIDYDIRMINHERDEIKKQMSQIEYNTNRANAKKASRDTLVKELEVAKKELVESAQDEQKQESTGNQNKDKVRSDTATQILHLLDKDTLPTPRAGNRDNQEELVIYEGLLLVNSIPSPGCRQHIFIKEEEDLSGCVTSDFILVLIAC